MSHSLSLSRPEVILSDLQGIEIHFFPRFAICLYPSTQQTNRSANVHHPSMSTDLSEPGLFRHHRPAEEDVGKLQHRDHLGQIRMPRGRLQEKPEAKHQGE